MSNIFSRKDIGKRGQFFGPFLAAMTLFILIEAYVVLTDAFEIGEDKGPTAYIGERQLELMSSYSGTGKVGLYVDQAAKLSFYHALKTIRDTGGFASRETDCGEYFGFSLWKDEEGNECTPTQRDVEGALSSLFRADFTTRLRAHPAIQKTRAFTEEAQVSSDVIGGVIDIPQTAKLKCTRSLINNGECRLHKDAIDKLIEATQLIADDQFFMVKSAFRPREKQASLLLKHLNGGATACGMRTIRKEFDWYDKVDRIPKRESFSTDDAFKSTMTKYKEKAAKYLSEHPEIERRVKTMGYEGCPHLTARAVDIHLYNGDGSKDTNTPRMLMCGIGWVNFGGEHWHFEYGTSSWDREKPRPDELDDALVGDPSKKTYHTSCYYGVKEGELRMYG